MYSRIIGTGSYLPERVLTNAELEGMVDTTDEWSLSRLVDWKDRATCVLFGDGAGAVVLGPSEQPGILSTHLHANGAYADLLFYPTGPSRLHHASVTRQNAIHMQGAEVFKEAVGKLAGVVEETLLDHGLDRSDIDWLVPHQANLRLIQATAKKLRFPMERVIVTVGGHGNTSAASVPLALDVGIRDGRIRPKDLLMLEAFGGGFTWGSALLRL